jgi:uroporphyrinogen-III decarboxylase
MEQMTSLERTMAVIRHQIPDRVPVDLHNFLVTIAGEMLAEAQIKFWRDFRHDVLLVENGVIAEAGACGCEVDWPVEGPPRVVGHVLADGLEKIEDLTVPDPWKTSPLRENLEAVRLMRKELGDQVYIMGRCDQAPASLAGALRGYE